MEGLGSAFRAAELAVEVEEQKCAIATCLHGTGVKASFCDLGLPGSACLGFDLLLGRGRGAAARVQQTRQVNQRADTAVSRPPQDGRPALTGKPVPDVFG